MLEKSFKNFRADDVYYLEFKNNNSKAVVISHGMAEHKERYEDLSNYLKNNGYDVYVIEHIGHGIHAKILGHMGFNEFDICVSNINELIELIKKDYTKVFLLGHSMGSFISQLYIERYHNISGLILSGSTCSNFVTKVGKVLANIIYICSKDTTKPSFFLNTLSFGSYNKKIKDRKSNFDWLSQDTIQVKKYLDDPLCGFVCSVSFFKNLTSGMVEMNKSKNIEKIDRNLPILLHSGACDPVSNFTKDFVRLVKQYKDTLKMENITSYIYPNDRHEIYNELNKMEVYRNTLDFLNNN